jgi:hypothetical protein
MRMLALVAFTALQLSMFTCGNDIHVDIPGDAGSQIAQHHEGTGDQGSGLIDYGSHLHASHVFMEQKPYIHDTPDIHPKRSFDLATLSFTHLPRLIEHPPKPSHG